MRHHRPRMTNIGRYIQHQFTASAGHGWLHSYGECGTALKSFSSCYSAIPLGPSLVSPRVLVSTLATSTAVPGLSSVIPAACPEFSVSFRLVSLAPSPEFPSSSDSVAGVPVRLGPSPLLTQYRQSTA